MKFLIYKASDTSFDGYKKPCEKAKERTILPNDFRSYIKYEIEVNTIQDLLDVIKETGSELILSEERVIIYDDYVE